MSDVIGSLYSQKTQPPVPEARVKTGKETVTLTSEDLRDRIINLRFTHKAKKSGDTPKTFTIRSDYEAVFTPAGFQYVVCAQKPAIKIEYVQVANKTAIEVNVDVTNLFIENPSDFDQKGEPIQHIEVQMGYRAQLPDWTKTPWAAYPIEDFYALKDNDTTTELQGRVSPTKLSLMVLSIEQLNNPPDRVTRFRCVVGTLENGLRWLFDEASLKQYISEQKSRTWKGKTPVNNLPDTFMAMVSRRFVRSSLRHDIDVTKTQKPDKDGKLIDVITKTVTIYDRKLNVVATPTLTDGIMSATDADNYGTLVYLSRVLWYTPIEELPNWGLTDSEVSQSVPDEHPMMTDMYDTAPAQLKAIAKQYPFIRYYVLMDGNYYAYHVKESSQEFFSDPYVAQQQIEGIVKIPAVYDITWGGTRQIRCPFFSLVGSGQTVAFQARYALNDLTGNFYFPTPDNNCFLVLLSAVSFSTTGKENMMTLTCVDVEGTYKPVTYPDGSIVPVSIPEDVPPMARSKYWKKQDLTVVSGYKGDAGTIDSSWHDLVQRLLQSAPLDKWDAAPSATDALDALQAWNADNLFTTSRLSDYPSMESALLGRDLPALYSKEDNPISSGNADVVHIYYPFLPDALYTRDTKMVTT